MSYNRLKTKSLSSKVFVELFCDALMFFFGLPICHSKLLSFLLFFSSQCSHTPARFLLSQSQKHISSLPAKVKCASILFKWFELSIKRGFQ